MAFIMSFWWTSFSHSISRSKLLPPVVQLHYLLFSCHFGQANWLSISSGLLSDTSSSPNSRKWFCCAGIQISQPGYSERSNLWWWLAQYQLQQLSLYNSCKLQLWTFSHVKGWSSVDCELSDLNLCKYLSLLKGWHPNVSRVNRRCWVRPHIPHRAPENEQNRKMSRGGAVD